MPEHDNLIIGRNPVRGRRSNWKKAIVTLAEGTIELA